MTFLIDLNKKIDDFPPQDGLVPLKPSWGGELINYWPFSNIMHVLIDIYSFGLLGRTS